MADIQFLHLMGDRAIKGCIIFRIWWLCYWMGWFDFITTENLPRPLWTRENMPWSLWINGLRYTKRSLMSWVVVIPKEGRARHVFLFFFDKSVSYQKKGAPRPPVLLLVWQRLRTLGTFSRKAAQMWSIFYGSMWVRLNPSAFCKCSCSMGPVKTAAGLTMFKVIIFYCNNRPALAVLVGLRQRKGDFLFNAR